MTKMLWNALAGLTGYGQCGRCQRPWNLVTSTPRNFAAAKIAITAMCDNCWPISTPAERVAAFTAFMDRAESRGSVYGNRVEVLERVARQAPGPLGS